MALYKKQNEGLIFLNGTGATENNILLDDEVNKAFNNINENIAGVDWEAEHPEQEIQDLAAHIPHIDKNKYAELADDEENDKNEDDEENDTKSTGVDNDGKSTGVRHNNESTGVDSNTRARG